MEKRSYIYPTKDEPTFWNIDAGVGAFLAGPIGLVIGGYVGKNRMQRELELGQQLSEPSFWNKGILAGAVIGGVVAAIGVTAIALPIAMATGAADILGVVAVGSLLGQIGGAIEGGTRRKEMLTERYEIAKAEYELQQPATSPNKQKGKSNAVTQQDIAIMKEKMAEKQSETFLSRIEQEGDSAAKEMGI